MGWGLIFLDWGKVYVYSSTGGAVCVLYVYVRYDTAKDGPVPGGVGAGRLALTPPKSSTLLRSMLQVRSSLYGSIAAVDVFQRHSQQPLHPRPGHAARVLGQLVHGDVQEVHEEVALVQEEEALDRPQPAHEVHLSAQVVQELLAGEVKRRPHVPHDFPAGVVVLDGALQGARAHVRPPALPHRVQVLAGRQDVLRGLERKSGMASGPRSVYRCCQYVDSTSWLRLSLLSSLRSSTMNSMYGSTTTPL